MRLCEADEWQTACEGSSPVLYPYGDDFEEFTCHGEEYTEENDAGTPSPTGALEDCVSANGVFDMSGNLREWTLEQPDTDKDIHVVRGGSFNTPMKGLDCLFRTSQAEDGVVLPAIGFRCCRD
jgi:formylglycine-generating enzyme required for sulfatase activity